MLQCQNILTCVRMNDFIVESCTRTSLLVIDGTVKFPSLNVSKFIVTYYIYDSLTGFKVLYCVSTLHAAKFGLLNEGHYVADGNKRSKLFTL